jgi:tRNA uracil 4-sulfurtransferase
VEPSDVVKAKEVLRHIFGVHTLCEMVDVGFESLSALVHAVVRLARDRVAGRTFAVRGQRHGEHSFHFADLAQQLGAALLPFSSDVNLDHPEVAVVVDV